MKPTQLVQIGGQAIHVRDRTPDTRVARSCLEDGEFAEIKTHIPTLRYGLIIDAGGYIGTAAIALALMYPEARIVSVEASSDNFAVLTKNVANFKNIIPINKALMGASRSVQLRNRGTGEWGFTIVEAPRDRPDAAEMHSIDGVTIDEILAEYDAEGIDVLKLDIEGGEIEVLDASATWMPKTTLVLAELHDRIVQGCGDSFNRATAGRRKMKFGQEKFGSLLEAEASEAGEVAAKTGKHGPGDAASAA